MKVNDQSLTWNLLSAVNENSQNRLCIFWILWLWMTILVELAFVAFPYLAAAALQLWETCFLSYVAQKAIRWCSETNACSSFRYCHLSNRCEVPTLGFGHLMFWQKQRWIFTSATGNQNPVQQCKLFWSVV